MYLPILFSYIHPTYVLLPNFKLSNSIMIVNFKSAES